MAHEHRIDIEQNRPERLELLRAQRLFYARAKLYQNLFAVMALLLPVIGLVFGASVPAIRPFLGFGSILVLLLDVGIISRMQREACKRGAKTQEQFDTEVLKLEWNRLVAGGKVDAEEVRAITSSALHNAQPVVPQRLSGEFGCSDLPRFNPMHVSSWEIKDCCRWPPTTSFAPGWIR